MHLGPRPRGAGRQGPEADAKQMGTFAAIFFVLKSNWGIGMMAMPFMLKSAGVVAGLGIFVLSMAMVTDSVHRLEQVQQALIDKWRTDRESGGTCEASGDAKHGGLSTGAGNGNSRLLINEQDDHYSAAAVPFLSPQYTAPQGDKDKEDASPSNPSVSAKEEEKNIGSGECSYTALPTRTEQPGLHREYLSNQKGSLLTSSTVSPHPASSPSQAHSFPHERQRFDTYVAITEGALGSRCGRYCTRLVDAVTSLLVAIIAIINESASSLKQNHKAAWIWHSHRLTKDEERKGKGNSSQMPGYIALRVTVLSPIDSFLRALFGMFGLAFGVAFIFLLTTESIIQQKVSRLESIFTSGSNFCRTETVPIALGIAAFSSEGVLVVWAPVAQTIKDIRRRRVVLLSTMGLFTLAYVIVAIFGYSLYEDDVMAELTLSMDSSMLINKIGVLCYCLTLVVTAIMVSYQTYSSYETLFFQPPRHRNIPPNTLHHHEASYATDSRASVPVITTTKRNYITANQDHPEKQRPRK
eukprot:jgi/Bigna1/141252/aug1.61_g15960